MATERSVLGGVAYDLTTPDDSGNAFKELCGRQPEDPKWQLFPFELPSAEKLEVANRNVCLVHSFASLESLEHERLARQIEQTQPLVLLIEPRQAMSRPTQFLHDPYNGREPFGRRTDRWGDERFMKIERIPEKPKPKYKNNKLDQKFYAPEEKGVLNTPKRDKAKSKAKKAARKRNR